MPPKTKSLQEKISRYTIDSNGCWIWTGRTTRDGYGAIYMNNKTLRAHRVIYEYYNGPIGNFVCCHNCDNTKCVNPAHIFLGTQLDNIADMIKKQRHNNHHGWIKKAKLNEEQVCYIRSSNETYASLGKKFNVGANTIKEAKLGITWKKIKQMEGNK